MSQIHRESQSGKKPFSWYNISLKNKLLLGFFLVGTIPSIWFANFIYQESFGIMKAKTERTLSQSLKQSLYPIEKGNRQVIEDTFTSLETIYSGSFKVINEDQIVYQSKESHEHLNESSVDMVYEQGDVRIEVRICEEGAYQGFYELNGWLVKITLIIITLSICFSIGISYRVIEGMEKLLGYFQKVKKGELGFAVEEDRVDEMGRLTQSFADMKEELSELIDKTYKLEISERNAQLKALQAQISPHFLYNALDMVNWSLIENGDFKTSEVVVALSDILRYSIDNSRKYVPIREEIQQIENYLLIQQSRFEERLTYSIYLPEYLQEYKIPKLLLQPLVENAVIHGIENKSRRGRVEVHLTECDDKLLFEVKDNGTGIKKERLEKLKAKLNIKEELKDENQRPHIGMANVSQRILLNYGENGWMNIESEIDQGTCIQLMISKETGENENTSD